MQTVIEARKEREYQEFRRYSLDQLRQDEITFAGEHLRAYNSNPIHYSRDEMGHFYVDATMDDGSSQRITLASLAADSAEKYYEIAEVDPATHWQYERTIDEQAHIAYAESMPPNSAFLVVSDCPETHLKAMNTENLFGYNLSRMLGFFQLFATDSRGELTIYNHSFDGNDQEGIASVYRRYGQEFSPDQSALSQPIFIERSEDVDLKHEIEMVLNCYDNELYRKTNQHHYAGMIRSETREEANAFVAQQVDLLYKHCEDLLFVGPRSALADDYRYNFAVAIRRRFEKEVVAGDFADSTSEMAGAGEIGRSRGEVVDSCGMSLSPTAESLAAQGFNYMKSTPLERKTIGSCLACLKTGTVVGGCNVCMDCEHDNTKYGIDLMKRRERNLKRSATPAPLKTSEPTANTSERPSGLPGAVDVNQAIKKEYGVHAIMHVKNIIGSTRTVVIDSRTKEEIASI